MSLSKVTLTKQPAEIKLCLMDFSNKMADAENITAIVGVTQLLYPSDEATADLTFAGQTYQAGVPKAQFTIAGGSIPARTDIKFCDYKVTVTITTDLGQTLENDGVLRVEES
jgi:hypothetical protein